jgi:hypothetical protein
MIATDSKVLYRGAGIKGPETVCKIYRSGDLYFAVAGMPADRNRNYYPTKLVGQNYKETDSFEANMTRIEQSLSTVILDEMKRRRTDAPDQFMQNQDGELDGSPAAGLPADGKVWQYKIVSADSSIQDFLEWINDITWTSEWPKFGVVEANGAAAPRPVRPLTRLVT